MPQSVTQATPSGGAVTISGIDFGFNFDTVVNTRDVTACAATNSSYPCQGSLRQFVINANALGGEGGLAQSGSGQIDGSTSFLPSGFESSIFMIPNGAAIAGQNTSYATQLSAAGVAVITLTAALPAIAGTSTRLDGTTQTVNVGNTNGGTLGTGGTVGVDAIPLPTFPRPEVQLSAAGTVLTVSGGGSGVLGLALQPGLSTAVGHRLPGAQQPGGHDRHRRQQRRQLGRLRHHVHGQQFHRAQQFRHREQLRHSHG